MAGKKGQRWKQDKDKVPNTAEYKKAKEDIAAMIRKGYLVNEIYAEILLDIPEMADLYFQRMVRAAYEEIKLTIHRNREYIFKLHMDRYETTYRKAIEMMGRDQRPLVPKFDWHEMVGRYIVAMKALKHKEDLLGLHNKEMMLQITEKEATMQLKEPEHGPTYMQVEKLTDDEMIELLNLLKEVKIAENDGVRRLVIKKEPLQISEVSKVDDTIIDTVYEELPINVTDQIEEIVHVEPPNEADENVLDLRDPEMMSKKRLNIDDMKKAMRQKVLSDFKETLANNKKQKPR